MKIYVRKAEKTFPVLLWVELPSKRWMYVTENGQVNEDRAGIWSHDGLDSSDGFDGFEV